MVCRIAIWCMWDRHGRVAGQIRSGTHTARAPSRRCYGPLGGMHNWIYCNSWADRTVKYSQRKTNVIAGAVDLHWQLHFICNCSRFKGRRRFCGSLPGCDGTGHRVTCNRDARTFCLTCVGADTRRSFVDGRRESMNLHKSASAGTTRPRAAQLVR